jgi:hypothetical protein
MTSPGKKHTKFHRDSPVDRQTDGDVEARSGTQILNL